MTFHKKIEVIRGELLDYYANECADGRISEELMETLMDNLSLVYDEHVIREMHRTVFGDTEIEFDDN